MFRSARRKSEAGEAPAAGPDVAGVLRGGLDGRNVLLLGVKLIVIGYQR